MSQKIKIKAILVFILIIIVLVDFILALLRKENKIVIATDIFHRSLHDTIEYVAYYKDDYGPGVESKIRGYDTPFCFNGINHSKNLLYLDFALKGDLIYKKSNSDTFIINRRDSSYMFKLIECKQYR